MTSQPPDAGSRTPAGIIEELYGTGTRGGPNTRAAAHDLGVSRRSVQRWIAAGILPATSPGAGRLAGKHQRHVARQQAAQAARPVSRLWQGLRKTAPDTSPAGMIASLYGTGPRGGPNTRAAAADLGVSQRTVQRWIQSGYLPPDSRPAQQLAAAHQQWASSPAGRRAQLNPRREARLRNRGTSMIFLGKIAISHDPRNNSTRSTTVDISGPAMARILDASLAGDDDSAHAALEHAFGAAFGGSVSLTIGSLTTYQ